MYEIPDSLCARGVQARRNQSDEVLDDSSWEQLAELTQSSFSIRFKVRGGFRLGRKYRIPGGRVSIRFKVRGGFRRVGQWNNVRDIRVSIRFEVRGAPRRGR